MSEHGYLTGLEGDVLAQWRRKSKNVLYQTDPEAWLWDVLGKRWWSLQSEIAQSFVQNKYTIVKSCNNVGKTQIGGDLTSWFVTVFPPTETIAMVSAPVRAQIDENMFRYLRENYNTASVRGVPFAGEITRWPRWIIHDPYDKDLVLPKRPADQNLVSAFQGIHFDHVAVFLDEAGGLQEDFYTGAAAVTNNFHARILAIGNPDERGTAFFQRFNDRVKYLDWNTISIRADDTPNFTGEVIYPDNPELDQKIKDRLIQPDWVDMMRRSASPGVVAAKVDAEFPGEDDNSFFTQRMINKAWENYQLIAEIEDALEATRRSYDEPTGYRYLGVDVGFSGGDKNVAYLNENGRIRKVAQWDVTSKLDGFWPDGKFGEEAVEEMVIANRVHWLADQLAVSQVRIDASGTSRGVHSVLKTETKFMNRQYILFGVRGGLASPDIAKWLNARAWHYDNFRKMIVDGELGLDPSDADLKTDMEAQTYKLTNPRRQLQITSKEDLKKTLKHSPDHLDAAIYSAIDFSGFTDGAAAGLKRGDIIVEDPWEDATLTGLPI